MLLLVVVLTASMAQQSLTLVMTAADRESHIREKWATTSFESSVLARAEEILNARLPPIAQSDESKSGHVFENSFVLNGSRYRLLLADEDAKVNLNRVFHTAGQQGVTLSVRELDSGETASVLKVTLRPFEVVEESSDAIAFDSWGQVFGVRHEVSNPAFQLAQATRDITCWGSRSLNLVRASDKSVRAILHTSQISEATIAGVLDRRPLILNGEFDRVFEELEATAEERAILESSIQVGSTCQSMWVLKGSTSQLHVLERNSGTGAFVSTFAW
tara:strand:+ start:11343 stop:12164 length:822 start_codon:yes stop_codon:yes gene_type:complete